MTKADQILSTIFRQLRPSLRPPHPAHPRLRPLSQFAPLCHPRFPPPSYTPKRGISQPPFSSRPLQTRQVSGSTSAPSSAVAHSPHYPTDTQSSSEKPPAYELTFTCKPCKHRSTHTFSKQGYHKGTVLITCPECSNRHVISDHLKVGSQGLCVVQANVKRSKAVNTYKWYQQIFGDQSFTLEDLMRQKGQLVQRGTLGGKGDVEFWDDGSQTERKSVEGSQ